MARLNKRKTFTHTFLYVLLFCLLAACTKPATRQNKQGEQLPLAYAKNFAVQYCNNYKIVEVFNPRQGYAVRARYYLVANDSVATPADGTRIHVPLKRTIATSCTHIGFLAQLHDLASVVGVSSPELIYNSEIRERYANGQIADVGNAFDLNMEKTMRLNPQAVITSGYENTDDANIERLQQVNIPIVVTLEWLETNLLARAEWIKFVATFYDQEALADSLFAEMADKYTSLRTQHSAQNGRSIMSGGNFRGTWYMPGGQSYMAQLFADAGGLYCYATDSTTGSLPLSTEKVLNDFAQADVWVGSSANTLRELSDIDAKHTLFAAYKKGEVYNFNRRTTANGGNDFWETGIVRPDLILADLIWVLDSTQLPKHQLFFSCKLP